MKGQDLVILFKLISLEQEPPEPSSGMDPFSVRALEASLFISKTETSLSLNRSIASGLAIRSSKSGHISPNRQYLRDFVGHGVKFVFPARLGAIARGIPTGFSAPPLAALIVGAIDDFEVWPFARGRATGQSVTPLFHSVPEAVQGDPRLYEYLALVDAVRIGGPREVGVAMERLSQRLATA
jgi:hypothetical protein